MNMKVLRRHIASVVIAVIALILVQPGYSRAAENNPYPTIAIADYLIGCMGSNGQTREAMARCSCSIDVVASIITHKDYIRAETVMQLRLQGGDKAAIFKTAARWKDAVNNLRAAQAEAEVRCF